MTDRHIKLRMHDEAKIYCREAVGAIAREDWFTASQLLLPRCRKLDMALQSLTPGGSEYVGDPDRCVATAQRIRESLHTSLKDAILRSKATGETP